MTTSHVEAIELAVVRRDRHVVWGDDPEAKFWRADMR
jgi:hypothetical protein